MHDIFDVFGSVYSLLRGLSHGKRNTGRTNFIVSMAKDGDTIVCPDRYVSGHIKQKLREEGKEDVRIIVSDPSAGLDRAIRAVHESYARQPNKGDIIFDHTWHEYAYHAAVIELDAVLSSFYDDMKKIKKSEESRGFR